MIHKNYVLTVECDNCGDTYIYRNAYGDWTLGRNVLRDQGWQIGKDKQYCPKHRTVTKRVA